MPQGVWVQVPPPAQMKNNPELEKYIPLDKSWIIRMGVLDIINGYSDIDLFLNLQKNLNDDLLSLKRCSLDWKTKKEIDVGESGTLYRFLKFISWKKGLDKTFIKHKTLKERAINDDSKIVNLSQSELLKIDNKTSQWASATVLCGDRERLENPPFKLKVTYDAVSHWENQRLKNKSWEPRFDKTIENQAYFFEKIFHGEKINFTPEQAEDFCFAYVFGFIEAKEGEKRWPALRGHESDRIFEIEDMFKKAKNNEEITSKDHRVVQSIAMWAKINNVNLNIQNKEAVNKSWPEFWNFLESL